jgi:hypothetical protein
MIISHKHKFIFIKTRKTAGSSIEVFLARHCGPDDVITALYPAVDGHQTRNWQGGDGEHLTAATVRAVVGVERWRDYFTFSIERNPWDKTVSAYYYWLNYLRPRQGVTTPVEFAPSLRRLAFGLPVDFPWYTDPQADCVPMVSFIMRYERIDKDLGQVCRQLGLPYDGTLVTAIKTQYRPAGHYRDYYTPELADLVGAAFSIERMMFGYDF